MSLKLRRHIVNKILDVIKPHNKLSAETILPKFNVLNYSKSENTISLSLNEVLSNSENSNELLRIKSDDLIKRTEILPRPNSKEIVFFINNNSLIKDVLTNLFAKPFNLIPKKKIIFEYSSPNIAKPFHLGHLRSTILGNYLSNLYKYLHNDVIRLNYLGDWGTQFGFLQVGVELLNLKDTDIEADPINSLYKAYVIANEKATKDANISLRAREVFNELEKGNFKNIDTWNKYKKYTELELTRIYNRLGITFDDYLWESMYSVKDLKHIIGILEAKNLLGFDNAGRKVAEINNKTIPVIKSDESSLYITRDIASAIDRYKKYNFDEMYYIVDNAQTDHFVNLKALLSSIDEKLGNRIHHIKFGRVEGMSTRKGNSVFLNHILDEAKILMAQKQRESKNTKICLDGTSDILGVSCVIVNDLKQRRQRGYEFNWDKILQAKGDTGTKLQYTHCRLCSLENNAYASIPQECDPALLTEPEVLSLVNQMAQFPDILLKSCNEKEACILVNYLFQLCFFINKAFASLPIKGQPIDLAEQRSLLFHTARRVLNDGMKILGLIPLEKM